ncbi:MAG: hypothetical protein MJD61_18865, partial [Proteobacteria bacterium]|nr:hypothetical protein [Pseudomonadota bacterium]
MRSGMAAVCFAILLAAFAGCSRSHLHGPALPDAAGGADAAADAATDASSDACMPETERCNAVDDDCDGMVDESLSRACGSDVGACRAGSQRCQEGVWDSCTGALGRVLESCNGVDDDCDGKLDEALMRPCGSTVGACEAGAETCSDGSWHSCTALGPSMEACDGMLDEDCDGTVDEGCDCVTGTARPCGSDVGACKAGSQLCEAGAWAACQDAVHPSLERCNAVDDDCDGKLDEALMRPCGSDVGVCQAGDETCTAGAWVDCSAIGPGPERCNDLDDDCDGSLDEGLRCAPPCEEGISAGWGHTCARLETGEIRCWGRNSSGQLGIGKGDPRSRYVPVPVRAAITGALDVAAGGNGTCARLEAGEVWWWGHQVLRFEGITPILVPGVMHASELSIAEDHICALLRSGEVMCWGKNLYGQLGNGDQTRLLELPVFVSGVRDPVSVHAERHRSCALLRTGELSCWGLVNGELALAPVTVVTLANAVQISVGEHHTCALLVNGQVQCWQTGPRSGMPETVANLEGAVEI